MVLLFACVARTGWHGPTWTLADVFVCFGVHELLFALISMQCVHQQFCTPVPSQVLLVQLRHVYRLLGGYEAAEPQELPPAVSHTGSPVLKAVQL